MAEDPNVVEFVEEQEPRQCDKCGREVMHNIQTGVPQPHYEPRPGQRTCVPRSVIE